MAYKILLIISGGIAAYKAPELVRRLREQNILVTCIMTKAASQFVTPLALSAVSGEKVYDNLFDLNDEAEMGHIQLSRKADLILVAPATADLMARAALGLADDLATTTLLATDTPVMMAPAMNVRMWTHPATQANLDILQKRGVMMVGPVEGDMACGEYGYGRMSDVPELVHAAQKFFQKTEKLAGKHFIVTSGPTHEPIDPVRYIANRSSGKQGHAIAEALLSLGAKVTYVTGPTRLSAPMGASTIEVESAKDMLDATLNALPADGAICAAAVADWHVASCSDQKIKKTKDQSIPTLQLAENPDILATVSSHDQRPKLVIGFAAETENVLENAKSKLARKKCDWIVANDVSPETGTFGGDQNSVHIIANNQCNYLEKMSKSDIAQFLVQKIADHFDIKNEETHA